MRAEVHRLRTRCASTRAPFARTGTQKTKEGKNNINNKTDKLYFYVRQLTYTFRVFRERNANKMFNMFKFKFERYMREDPSF